MQKRILINREDCEVRVAFLEDDELVEVHTEQLGRASIVGNIYKGIVEDVKPGLQAAFIDCGLPRNVFLHFMDVRAESLVLGEDNVEEAIQEAAQNSMPGMIQKPGRRPRMDPSKPQPGPPIREGDEILVQIVKDEINGKAPRVTANISIPGRYLVLLPYPSQQGGVSRKIAMGEDRFRLKKLLSALRDGEHSFIVRTAGVGQPEEAVLQDVESLKSIWQHIIERYRRLKGPGLVYNDHDILGKLVRDAFPPDLDEVICDREEDLEEVKSRIGTVPGQKAPAVKVHTGISNIFEHYGAEKQLDRVSEHKVWLKSGGFLVVDENEALTAIDVNSGRFTQSRDQERTSFKINMEACKLIAQQIRLRDIGGIIVIDFIDMMSRDNQETVSEELRRHLKRDRAKHTVGRIGDFGLMVLTRKRQRGSLRTRLFDSCPYCTGSGEVLKKDQTFRKMKYELKRVLQESKKPFGAVVITTNPEFAHALRDHFLPFLQPILAKTKTELVLRADHELHTEDYTILPIDRAPERIEANTVSRIQKTILPPARTFAEAKLTGEEVAWITPREESEYAEELLEDRPVSATEMDNPPPPSARVVSVQDQQDDDFEADDEAESDDGEEGDDESTETGTAEEESGDGRKGRRRRGRRGGRRRRGRREGEPDTDENSTPNPDRAESPREPVAANEASSPTPREHQRPAAVHPPARPVAPLPNQQKLASLQNAPKVREHSSSTADFLLRGKDAAPRTPKLPTPPNPFADVPAPKSGILFVYQPKSAGSAATTAAKPEATAPTPPAPVAAPAPVTSATPEKTPEKPSGRPPKKSSRRGGKPDPRPVIAPPMKAEAPEPAPVAVAKPTPPPVAESKPDAATKQPLRRPRASSRAANAKAPAAPTAAKVVEATPTPTVATAEKPAVRRKTAGRSKAAAEKPATAQSKKTLTAPKEKTDAEAKPKRITRRPSKAKA